MRGLTAEEREALELVEGCDAECLDLEHGETGKHVAVLERLSERGLVYWRECDFNEGWSHGETSALGRLALACDAAARGAIEVP